MGRAKDAHSARDLQLGTGPSTCACRISLLLAHGTSLAAIEVRVTINVMGSTVLAVTDLTSASYKLVGFAALVAGTSDGEVVLVSSYGGGGGGAGSRNRLSEPPPGERVGGWRRRLENRLRQEGQLLERQRQWCADRGVRCQAELYDGGPWQDFVLQTANRASANLILVGANSVSEYPALTAEEFDRFASDAPCPVSLVRLPPLAGF